MANAALPQAALDKIRTMQAAGFPDREIAEALGINKTTVSKKRREMGLPANDMRFTPTDAQLADLREMSNHAMERKYGNSADTWSRLRRRYGIDPFRLPTVRDGVPVSPLTGEVIEDKPKPEVSWAVVQNCFSGLAPRRPGGIAYDAAAFLQGERYAVFNRKKLGLGDGWQVGRVSMSEAGMIAKAERIKARRMGVAA